MTAKRGLQAALAVITGLMLVTAAALGGVWATNSQVDSLDDAANQFVQGAEGQALVAAGIYVGAAGYMAYEEYVDDDPRTDQLEKADALETKKEIYDSASTQKQNNQITRTAYNNYLSDTTSIALMEGKNAYIRALENGSSEAIARNKATRAVADYYSVKQKNLIASWNVSVTVADSGRSTAENATGVDADYVYSNGTKLDSDGYQVKVDWLGATPNGTVQLVNETAAPVRLLQHQVVYNGGNVTGYTPTVGPTQSKVNYSYSGVTASTSKLSVKPPTHNQDRLVLIDFSKFATKWTEVQTQNDDVQSQVDSFVNETFEKYQRGQINTSDLVDPYLGAREYSPETSATWGLRTLSAMGLDSPDNVSSIGEMEVVSGGVTYKGVLMTDNTPSGGFVVGDTYNATGLNGSQFIALSSGGAHELEGEFTLKSAERTDGTNIGQNKSVTYQDITYETANTTEYQTLQRQLNNLTAQINARQQDLRNSGGGGGFLPDFGLGGIGGLGVPVTLLMLAGGAVLVLGRD